MSDDEAEDIPSDFFDDFTKEGFMDGLSVIDSWDEDKVKKSGSRIDAKALDSVKDLRELIDGKEEGNCDNAREQDNVTPRQKSATRSDQLDDYIKPGSRRDYNKTNAAIKRDKEVKVKEYLAKHLESSDDLKPPGTELDDFFDGTRHLEPRKPESVNHAELQEDRLTRDKHRDSPRRRRSARRHRSPRYSPQHSRSPRYSPQHSRSPRYSPQNSRARHASFRGHPFQRPYWNQHYVHRYSPPRKGSFRDRHMSPLRRSPRRYSPRRSPHRSPTRHSAHSRNRSRSPYRRPRTHSKSAERIYGNDSFLYPKESPTHHASSSYHTYQGSGSYSGVEMPELAGSSYPFPHTPAYTVPYRAPGPYDYRNPGLGSLPQPVPAPVMNPIPIDSVPLPINPVPPPLNPVPTPVAPPSNIGSIPLSMVPTALSLHQPSDVTTPYDALAQLVADGKLSKEDYLKLAPNKSMSARVHGGSMCMDDKTRVEVINRCNLAMSKLGSLCVPNKLVINNNVGNEPLALASKFCSPLKRQPIIQLYYTHTDSTANAQHNKQLIETIINTVGLNDVVMKPKKKVQKNMVDAAVQTTKTYCDICEIRESTERYEVATSVEPGDFSATVHTQVVEQDLMNSKAVFNPSGSIGDGAPISIAHLTPAQLVSQLAARAKTLKQSDSSTSQQSSFGRRPNYDGRGGHQYQNNYNYRY